MRCCNADLKGVTLAQIGQTYHMAPHSVVVYVIQDGMKKECWIRQRRIQSRVLEQEVLFKRFFSVFEEKTERSE